MRRIYESDAIHRDDEEPAVPNPRESDTPQAFRSVDSTALSRRLLPSRLRQWAISVDVRTPDNEYPIGAQIPFEVTMKNALPMPVTIPVRSRVPWNWSVNGFTEASHLEQEHDKSNPSGFQFDRGERKEFRKRWDGMFKVESARWEEAEPGEYTIGAGVNVDSSAAKGLYDETTIQLID